jgi:hypothetical protein
MRRSPPRTRRWRSWRAQTDRVPPPFAIADGGGLFSARYLAVWLASYLPIRRQRP